MDRSLIPDLALVSMGVAGYLSLHYLWVWLRRRTERAHLWIGLWCVVSLLYLGSRLTQLRASDDAVRFAGDWWAFVFAVAGIWLILRFVGELCPESRSRAFERVAAVGTLAVAGAHAVTPWFVTREVAIYRVGEHEVAFSAVGVAYAPFLVVWSGAVYLWAVGALARAERMTRRDRSVWIAGLSLYLALGLHDVLLFDGWLETGPSIFELGFVVLAVALSLRALGRVERIQADLQGAVSDRTRRLERALEDAEAAARVKSEFLAKVSHEIRTPLNGIIGVTQLLERTGPSDEQRELIRSMRRSEDLLLSLINDVLDFSRIEAGGAEVRPSTFDLRSVVAEACELHRAEADERGITLDWTVAPGLPERVRTDPRSLAQILHNLVGNAVKFTEEGSVEVRVVAGDEIPPPASGDTTEQGSLSVRFEVRDTGIGIPADAVERLFEAFSQVDASTRRERRGTGLGLAIVRQLVERLGGEVEVESRLGEGSVFRFWIPTDEAYTGEVEVGALRSPDLARFAGRTVLVVEDNDINRLVTSTLLGELELEVVEAASGEEALAAWERAPVDLVLMDCQMPGMDGFEATRRLRELGGGGDVVPIVALTAHAMEGDRERCLSAGMDDYLAKPLLREDLVRLLEQVFGREERG